MRWEIIIGLMLMAGCTTTAGTVDSEKKSPAREDSFGLPIKNPTVDKLEILHFHATNQCYSCITVGKYAEETVNTYFADEVKSGRIVFAHVNGELPENSELVRRYGATGSSIWLGIYKGEDFEAEQNINVWYKIGDKKDYMDYFKGVIEGKLYG